MQKLHLANVKVILYISALKDAYLVLLHAVLLQIVYLSHHK
jgi:hypothetical protein